MHDAALRLGQRDVQGARHPQRKAMRYLNETVLLLRESLDNLAKAQTPSAFAEAMQQLLGLSEQQSQLNQASEQALGQMPGPALQQQIARLSAEQQGLMQALDEIARSLRGHRGAQQRVQAIQDEMRGVLADLQRRRLTQRTRQNQERLYQRMLDASRSIHSRGFDEKRRSITADDQPYAGPTALPVDRGQTPDAVARSPAPSACWPLSRGVPRLAAALLRPNLPRPARARDPMKISALICVLGLWSATDATDATDDLPSASRASAPVAGTRRTGGLHRPAISSRRSAARPVDRSGPDVNCRVQSAPQRPRPRRPLLGRT